MFHKLVISLAILGVTVTDSTETCILLDDKIEQMILKPFKEVLGSCSSEFISFGEWRIGHFGIQATWDKGYVGNFSTAYLDTVDGRSSAQVCTSGNVRRLTLDMNLGLRRMEARFKNFKVSLPFFKTQSAWAIFTTPGSRANVTMTAVRDMSVDECSVSINNVEFKSWGPLELTIRGNSGRNLATDIFFNLKRPQIIKFLSMAGVGKKVSEFTRNRLSAAMEDHKNVICDLMA